MDDGQTEGLISERLALVGSAAVGQFVQTRHVVGRKRMPGVFFPFYKDKTNSTSVCSRI